MEDKIKNIVCGVLGIKENDYSESMALSDIAEYDSLSMMRIMMKVEKEFDVSINHEDLILENFKSPDSIMNMLKKYSEA